MVTLSESPQLSVASSDDFLPPIHRWLARTGLVMAGATLAAIGLSAVIQYKVAVRAEATVRPTGELRLVQPAIEGTVAEIFVKENQTVHQGDVVAKLDDTQLQIRQAQLQSALQQLQQQAIQLNLQRQSLQRQIASETTALEALVAAATADLARNQREYRDRTLTTQADLEAARTSLELAQDQYQRYHQLWQAGAIATAQVKERESAVAIAQANLAKAQAITTPSDATVTMAQAQVAQQKAKGMATVAALQKEQEALQQQESQIQAQIANTTKDLQQIEQQLQQTVIRATADGTILSLNLRNSGQVVRPGDPLLQLAPINALLVIKANASPQNIHKIKVGQVVKLKVTACPYPDYGTLQGVVSSVAADATTATTSAPSTDKGASRSYFEVSVTPTSMTFGPADTPCQLQAGMTATASIITEQDTALRFLLRKARLLSDL